MKRLRLLLLFFAPLLFLAPIFAVGQAPAPKTGRRAQIANRLHHAHRKELSPRGMPLSIPEQELRRKRHAHETHRQKAAVHDIKVHESNVA